MLFKDIAVPETVTQHLLNSFVQKRVPHARLLFGPEGSGALPLALAYARLLLCSEPSQHDACGRCNNCRKVEGLIHPDLHFAFPLVKPSSGVVLSSLNMVAFRRAFLANPFMTPADWQQEIAPGENKQAGIFGAEAGDIVQQASLKAFEGGYKIFIVWQPEAMHISAGNKLLKLLEEPPEKTLFLLVAHSIDEMLPTVLSRLQMLEIPAADSVSSDESRLFFEKFVSLMRLCWGVRSKNLTAQNNAVQSLLALAEELSEWQRAVIKRFLIFSSRMIRENLVMQLEQPQLAHLNEEEEAFAANFHKFIHPGNAASLFEELERAYAHIDGNVSERLVLLDLSMQMVRLIRVGA